MFRHGIAKQAASNRTIWWVRQLGMLAGTAIFVYAGSSVPNLQTLADRGIGAVFTPSQLTQIVIAFVLLGVFPLIVRDAMKLILSSKSPSDSSGCAESQTPCCNSKDNV